MTKAEKYAAMAANNEAIAANVPKVYTAGQSSMVDESKLIPKTVSGNYISVDDVSEVPHSVACKVSGVEDATTVHITVCGKNLLNILNGKFIYRTVAMKERTERTLVLSGNGTYKNACFALPSSLAGKYITISGNWTSTEGAIGGLKVFWINEKNTPASEEIAKVSSSGGKSTGLVPDAPEGAVALGILVYGNTNGQVTGDYTTTYQDIQVEIGDKATDYEPYNGQNLTPTTDGTVEGMTSVSPYMNIFTDTESVNIEVTYNKSYGMQTEYDRFWDNHPTARGEIDGTNMFSGRGWNDVTFKPKYDIKPTYGYMLFKGCGISDLVERVKECGVDCDLSVCSNFYYAFADSTLTHLGKIYIDKDSFTTATSPTGNMFAQTTRLHTIDRIIVNDNGTTRFATTMFQNASGLKNITFEGVIGTSIDFQWCPLTRESITNIIEHLSPTVTDQTVTFKKSAKEEAFTDDEWAELTATKPNWTFTLL